jgi:phospholipase/carboxylesterase
VLTDAIIDEARTWPHVTEQESGVSVEGARAVVLAADAALGPESAFMVSHEFCHAHAQGDFSFHVALPEGLAADAEAAGWAEPHFLVRTGQVPPTVVMVYAPRDTAERDVVLGLVRASYDFARSAPAVPEPGSAGTRREA